MGERLQDLRLSAGLSQSQLARAAGIPTGSLKNWEQGLRLPRLDAAYRLAKALGITLDLLAGRIFDEPPIKPAKPRSDSAATKTKGKK
jgi:transcriptional regulator with XRE-family HTH domain